MCWLEREGGAVARAVEGVGSCYSIGFLAFLGGSFRGRLLSTLSHTIAFQPERLRESPPVPGTPNQRIS